MLLFLQFSILTPNSESLTNLRLIRAVFKATRGSISISTGLDGKKKQPKVQMPLDCTSVQDS
ncbi:hypothetical protein SAMN02745215_03044 [Desulfitobacterium chlororespirans DSM 11544]|uniref:Uncharacterized protein n=1 Tax=Desulfitobacterium chlororespirans DSM 11544 TaxID=1121395 RepID=A0A1M7U5F0_9FIRM|nr:hypothetical protein SAMN02745215_03044 [Desulfitobacterium chlororespirans DSM 11544]